MTTTCDRCGEVNPADIHTCTPKAAPVQEPVQSCYCPNCESLSKELAEIKAQPAPANLWLYWKVDGKSVVTGPFKARSKDEAYGLDCIDQTQLTVPAAQRQCNWPTCQSEEYQQLLAEQIKQELVTGAAQRQCEGDK